jgi:D-aspartate ligase
MNLDIAQVHRGSRSLRRGGLGLDVDTGVPALVFKVGSYPLHVGGVGAIRSLGRLGVPVYAITEPGRTPAAASRYCAGRFVWRSTVHEHEDALISDLQEVGDRIGRRSVIVATDDEAAVLVAEHAAELSERFLLPQVAPGLPARLASKTDLVALCKEHDVAAPASAAPASLDEVDAFIATAIFPVVIKNAEPWERRRRPVVPYTMLVYSPEELLAIVGRMFSGRPPGLLLQEYIPAERSQDWMTDLYCNVGFSSPVVLTGLKLRSWPPHAGATACGYAIVNPEVVALTERFTKEVGFSGIADLDWRLDLRDGQYKLVDFNPRLGSRFRLTETESGIDVLRAMHLDLTGRDVPRSPQLEGKRLVLEHVDIPARLSYRMVTRRAEQAAVSRLTREISDRDPPVPTSTEFAWLAADDPGPFVAMLRYAASAGLTELRRQVRALTLRIRARRPGRGG